MCGVVMNGMDMKSMKYSYKYKYGKYGYGYGDGYSYGNPYDTKRSSSK